MKRSTLGMGAALAAGAVLTASATLGAAPALAAGDDSALDVVNTETVKVYTDSTGDVDSRKVYEQLSLTGDGTAQIVNPIETDGLRNLDGFGGVSTDEGTQTVEVDVDGAERLRSVSDYSGDLPLELSAEYRLDGETVEPGDVVGAAGELEVIYTVRNTTSAPTEVTFPDGKGGTRTETVQVPIPIVGSLSTVAPPGFTDVQSATGNLAGDGRGGTKLSFTMTLFPPLGSDTATFGYTAQVTDGVVPNASISALPVNPLESSTFKTAADSYQKGADSGAKLAAGATEIDTNLLKLRDGAAELLAGLIQLRDGADQLREGLAEKAAPGSRLLADGAIELETGLGKIAVGTSKLADGASELDAGAGKLRDGASQLDAGAGKLDDGAKQLDDGAGRLADGTGAALSGSRQLQGGLERISGGLDQLSGKLPGAQEGITQLQQGVDLLLAGFGDTGNPSSLIGGLEALETGAGQLRGGLGQLRGDGSAGNPGLVGAQGGVNQVKAGLDGSLAPGGSLDQLEGGLQGIKAFCAAVPDPTQAATCAGTADKLLAGVANSRSNLTAASAGLGQVSGGLGNAITALDGQLIPGTDKLVAGLGSAQQGAVDLKDGVGQVDAGLLQLQAGIGTAVTGVFELADGAKKASSGSGDLSDGLSQLDAGASDLKDGTGRLAAGTGDLEDGTGRLSAGTGELKDGTGRLSDGATQLDGGAAKAAAGSGELADGAGELADGLGDAADGSERLADGLGQAAGGAPALVDGAGRLSSEGMSQLIEAGEETTQEYGELYAVIAAAGDRADAEKMAYGAPEGAQGLTAYSYELVGNDGEGGRNLTRGLGAALLAVAGLGGLGLRRRLA